MKITAIRARNLAAPNKESRAIFDPPAPAALGGTGPFRDGSFTLPEPAALTVVEVETDAGITGLGTVGGFNIAAESIIHGHLAPLLVGRDPLAIEALWDHMYHQTQQYGLRGAVIMAMSGIDLALWDILAKECGQPVYNLIGGKSKSRVPLYMSLLRNNAGLENTVARAAADAEAGFRAMKYFFTMTPAHGPEGVRREVEVVREIRAAIGPDVQFMVDAHIQWDLPYAKRMIDSIAEYDIAWLEEPLSPDDIDGHRRLADYSPIPIAAGEHARTRFDYLDFINAGVHFLQPDINRVGGYTEVLRICALAATHHRAVCPHQGWLHSYHLITAKTCCPIGEYFPARYPLTGNSYVWGALRNEPEAVNGCIELSDEPGFGWELNEEFIREHHVSFG
ncbi:MAG: L-rhamnonate dehydratase [Chloroflexi bacterium]|nr:L-rhamnonate dehydratase [Chloroflexota bacterium]